MTKFYTNGKAPIEITIDDEDKHLLSRGWYAVYNPSGKLKAIISNGRGAISPDGKRQALYLHREILGLEINDGTTVDHIDGNPAHNCKSNLRICTQQQNSMNREKGRDNTSGFKGVSWNRYHSRWASNIKANGRRIFLGYFDDKVDAHKAYCVASEKYHGEFGRV